MPGQITLEEREIPQSIALIAAPSRKLSDKKIRRSFSAVAVGGAQREADGDHGRYPQKLVIYGYGLAIHPRSR
jgi:hypothetical protein